MTGNLQQCFASGGLQIDGRVPSTHSLSGNHAEALGFVRLFTPRQGAFEMDGDVALLHAGGILIQLIQQEQFSG